MTCGVCQTEFPLQEIVKFVQHKVLTCNKENYERCKSDEDKSGQRKTKTSAESPEKGESSSSQSQSVGSPSVSGSGQVDQDRLDQLKTEDKTHKVELADAESNTNITSITGRRL